MAVTIIGEDKKHVKETSCSNCSAKLEYTMADTYKRKEYDYGGGCDIVTYINCPRCSQKLCVKSY